MEKRNESTATQTSRQRTEPLSGGTRSTEGATTTRLNEETSQLRKAATETGEKAKQTANTVATRTKEKVATLLDSQKSRAAKELETLANNLRQSGQSIQGEKTAVPLPQYLNNAADGINRVASYLESKSVGDMVGEVERFARNQPVLFLGGSFVLGLLAVRFLKSS